MSLFKATFFESHSGIELPFKIECNTLSDESIATLASLIARKMQFQDVYGIPTGGTRLAEALREYCASEGPILIVDDVLTTGNSMEEARQEIGEDSVGVVIFARGSYPSWVNPIFQLSEWAQP